MIERWHRLVDQRTAALAWAKKWRWVLLMNLYLVSPVLLFELRLRDKNVLFELSASLFWLVAAQLLLRRVWLTHALLFPLYLLVGVDLYMIANYQTRLASTMILSIVENFSDTWDFLESDLRRTVGSILLVLAGYGFCLWKVRKLRVTTPRVAVLLPFAGVAVVYLGVYRYLGSWANVIVNDRNSPFGIFSQSYLTASLHSSEMRDREGARSFHFGAKRADAPAQPELYVLVVGESARRHNWSLYGYPRLTNPRLSQVDNLLVFRDMLTQVAQTQFSVPLIIARGSVENQTAMARETSILSLFHEVGFKTYWLSTQQRDLAMSPIGRYTTEADFVRFFERRHDGALVDYVKTVLAAPSAPQKMFLVLHTLGSHFNLNSRYPSEFATFPDGSRSMFSGTSAALTHAELIGAYDNSILYTDYVLSELIATLKQRAGIKALLYVPDHGDNLRDDSRDIFGHGHSNEYDVPIPMLFWFSKEYAQQYPDKVAAATSNTSRRLNTRAVFYSLTDMAGVTLDDPNVNRLSVFSPSLSDIKRMVMGMPTPFDFDEWMARTGTKIPALTPPQ
ncbi:MAG TPA: phosphoethanolamine transferase [Polyangiaceae bacterium]